MTFAPVEVFVIALAAFAVGSLLGALKGTRSVVDATRAYTTETNEEINRQKYASFSDDDLRNSIRSEEEWKARGFHPETLDIRKRGADPHIADMVIAGYQAELKRREEAAHERAKTTGHN